MLHPARRPNRPKQACPGCGFCAKGWANESICGFLTDGRFRPGFRPLSRCIPPCGVGTPIFWMDDSGKGSPRSSRYASFRRMGAMDLAWRACMNEGKGRIRYCANSFLTSSLSILPIVLRGICSRNLTSLGHFQSCRCALQ